MSVDRHLENFPGSPFLRPDPELVRYEYEKMKQYPYKMDSVRRKEILGAIIEVCQYRGWLLHAAHVRSSHVHAVVQANTPPQNILGDFKAYSSRRLNTKGLESKNRIKWSRHGSTKYLWTKDEVERAVKYVIEEQGEQMEIYSIQEASVTEN